MRLSKQILPGIVAVTGTLIISSVVYAIEKQDFSDKAQQWFSSECDSKLTSSKNNVENNQSATICHNYQSNKEQDIKIDELSTKKSAVLIDANNRTLGTLVGSDKYNTFYSQSLNLLVSADYLGNIVTQSPNQPYVGINYESMDCTGQPYLLVDYSPSIGAVFAGGYMYTSLIKSSNTNGYYSVKKGAQPVNLPVNHSIFELNSCDPAPNAGTYLPLDIVQDLPFTDPLASPLQLSSR